MTIEEIKRKIINILPRNHVVFAGVFGSHARGEAKSESDVDILVRFELKQKLQEALKIVKD